MHYQEQKRIPDYTDRTTMTASPTDSRPQDCYYQGNPSGNTDGDSR